MGRDTLEFIFGITAATLIAWIFWEVAGAALYALYSEIGSQGFYSIAKFFALALMGCIFYTGWLSLKEINND